ncbi:uncharacterized protein ACA1_181990 [Acanthamoeba castellanii str. Neff]|uniref:Uncharacterized protein n=1 Tax=Acanthamoeba castellanii (strain ATCC 30010 / Neff) TaxID=1257118 RepID=L8H986_ACACF|nr:uncharacterized protein ACA1_181990 [Acanthamoeba castellanii str. Neff]ELR21298.1 hypothetical protein ACA1_181990 [Acanthamoeba castellanii str. Neff]
MGPVFEYAVTLDAKKTDIDSKPAKEEEVERPAALGRPGDDKSKDAAKRRSESSAMGLVKGGSDMVMGTLGVLGAATTATTAATLSAMSTITPVITGGLVGGSAPAQPAVPTGPTPVVMVFFIGGCTYTEIAALRWLSKQPGTLALFGRPAVTIEAIDVADEARSARYVIGTTKLINGDTLLDDFVDKL